MHFTIYRTINLVNGKEYIGKHKTADLNDGYLGSGTLLRRAINKYGTENFSKEILFVFDNETEMNAKEAELVTESYVISGKSYNLTLGGQGGFSHINRVFDPTSDHEAARRNKIRETNKIKHPTGGPRTTPESARKAGATMRARRDAGDAVFPWTGKEHSSASIEKMKKSHADRRHQQGEKNSQFGTCWISKDGEKPRKIRLNDLNAAVEDGWSRGRK